MDLSAATGVLALVVKPFFTLLRTPIAIQGDRLINGSAPLAGYRSAVQSSSHIVLLHSHPVDIPQGCIPIDSAYVLGILT